MRAAKCSSSDWMQRSLGNGRAEQGSATLTSWFLIIDGGITTGYTARTFVEIPMADGRLAIVSKEFVYKEKAQVVIVDGGYIGMVVVAATTVWKLDTTIIFPEDHLMQKLFTPSLARRYEEFYKENGVKFFKGTSLKNIETSSNRRVTYVKLEDISNIEADAVIVGIGAKHVVGPFERENEGLATEGMILHSK